MCLGQSQTLPKLLQLQPLSQLDFIAAITSFIPDHITTGSIWRPVLGGLIQMISGHYHNPESDTFSIIPWLTQEAIAMVIDGFFSDNVE